MTPVVIVKQKKEEDGEDNETYKNCKNELKNMIKNAKNLHWRALCNELNDYI